jgi:hypothetical protein
MSKLASRHIPGLIVLMIFLGLVVPPFVNVGRYRAYIADSMSRALGRPVTFGAISLRLLPQPGFDFENFTIGDDPAFSPEPILRAEAVTAYLRISSLWRGRMEIARLSFKYPSLNLVRRSEGDWNVESLLYRASRTSAAPTTSMRPQARTRFPYIESTDGRINFKVGLEKKVFAFTEAKFAVWSPNENEWRVRLQAKPVRTDLVVADTGLVRAEGSLLRADELRNTQLNLTVAVERSQLGQLTRLIWGRDRGWRGALDLDAQLSGTPADLKFATDASLQNFRRHDIMRGETLQFQTHCTGRLSTVEQSIDAVRCQIPASPGKITIEASMHGWKAESYGLALTADKVPMNWVAAVARHAKRDLPDDLSAGGTLSGAFQLQRSANAAPVFSGEGSTDGLVLRSSVLTPELAIGKIQLSSAPVTNSRSRSSVPANRARLDVLAFPVPMGMPAPATATGWFSRDGYNFSLLGDGDLARILNVARALGIGAPKFQLKGSAHLDAQVEGEWKGFVQSDATGTMQVHNLIAEVPGVASPVKVASADVVLQQNLVSLRRMVVSIDTLKATGNATFPRHCEEDAPCVSQVNAQVDDVDLDEVNRLLNPRLKSRPWYRLFGMSGERSVLAGWEANGTLEARHLTAKLLSADKVATAFELHKGKLALKDMRADIFGGTHAGIWTADFSGNAPVYSGSGTVSRVAVAQVAGLMKDTWGTGILNGSYEFKLSGWDVGDLLSSAKGTCQFQWRDGTLKHLALDGKTPQVRFPQWTGQCEWSRDGFRVSGSKMQAASGIYVISGTVQPSKDLQLEFVRGDGTAYQVTGTLEKPHVAATQASRTTEAALHP